MTPMTARPLHPLFAAELSGIDLAAGIDAQTRDTIARTMDQYAVTVLPDQHLDDEKQSAFASLYGPLEVAPQTHSKEGGPAAPARIQNRNIFDVSNLDERGQILSLDDQRRAYRDGENGVVGHTHDFGALRISCSINKYVPYALRRLACSNAGNERKRDQSVLA